MYAVLHYADRLFSLAIYGLVLFFNLTKEELAGRHPFSKFLSIKLITGFIFYQTIIVHNVLSALLVSR
jgi:hypothetical protein